MSETMIERLSKAAEKAIRDIGFDPYGEVENEESASQRGKLDAFVADTWIDDTGLFEMAGRVAARAVLIALVSAMLNHIGRRKGMGLSNNQGTERSLTLVRTEKAPLRSLTSRSFRALGLFCI